MSSPDGVSMASWCTQSHKLLISELIQHLQFAVQPPDLKKRIESLIEREFLERDKDDKTVYRYLA